MGSLKELLYLSRSDVEKLAIPMTRVVQAVEEAFLEKHLGTAQMPPKPGIHPSEDAFIHAMPAYLPSMASAGVKWVSGFPGNPKAGLPYITGLLILNDPSTGVPQCVMDCTWITAKRTGATTAIAAKHLARKDARVMGILGCGVQGRSNLEALRVVCSDLGTVKAYDVKDENRERYVYDMECKHEIDVIPVRTPREAVEGCDIVVTAGPILKHPTPVIDASWFENGGFACALDFDSYWTPGAMHSMDRFCTDDIEQLAYYKTLGYFLEIPEVHAQLDEILSGTKPGRQQSEERIMSMNLGLAIADMATAILIYQTARRRNAGTWLPL